MMKNLFFILLVGLGGHGWSQDAQWKGPQRNGIYPGRGLMQEWPKGGPERVLLKDGLGSGFSTPLMYHGRIYVSGRRDNLDVVTAVEMGGRVLWETAYGRSWQGSNPDTRNTPTIEDNRIYLAGGMGTVSCMDTETGDILWQVNTHELYGGEFHTWGMAESLLLTGTAVISSPVGDQTVLVALDKKDGTLMWKTESIGDIRSYVSPLMAEYKGKQMILAVTRKNLVAVDPEDGNILLNYDIYTAHTPEGRRHHTNTPLYRDGEIFVTSGYNAPAVMLKMSTDGRSAGLKWSSDVLDTHHGGVVLVDGYIYGSNWINNGNGNWVCLEWESGRVMYEEKWNNKGSIIYADRCLYVYEEKNGNVGLVELTPEGFRVKSSFQIREGTGPHWAHPSIYKGYLLIRHGEVLMVYDIMQNR